MKWYDVFHGRQPGVYNDWPTCNDQVIGFKRASFKSFRTEEEAYAAYNAYFGTKHLLERRRPTTDTVVYKTPQWKDAILVLLAVSFLVFFRIFTFLDCTLQPVYPQSCPVVCMQHLKSCTPPTSSTEASI